MGHNVRLKKRQDVDELYEDNEHYDDNEDGDCRPDAHSQEHAHTSQIQSHAKLPRLAPMKNSKDHFEQKLVVNIKPDLRPKSSEGKFKSKLATAVPLANKVKDIVRVKPKRDINYIAVMWLLQRN
jgi:hypothetical protein